MSIWDWLVLFGTLLTIVLYGAWKTRGNRNLEGYFRGDTNQKWWTIGLSVMATQASAITFLSTPGQAYDDGMRFLQFYLGVPLAMIFISAFVLPIYYRLKVYTAYEYLENRFDLNTRLYAAFLFLVQRGLAAGITIYAPAIILSSLMGWSLYLTNILIGTLVIFYTVLGGSKAVSQTQKHQMAVMMGGMIVAGILIISMLPEGVGFSEAVQVSSMLGKLDAITFEVNLEDRYNVLSGLTGGFFLALSYFGTDQSQVARYLGGKSLTESRLGLLFNGLFKIPMQFLILFIGVLVFVFYIYNPSPILFNNVALDKVRQSEYADSLTRLEARYSHWHEERRLETQEMIETKDKTTAGVIARGINDAEQEARQMRDEARELVTAADPKAETKDKDYIFLTFVLNHLPIGVVGLLLAVIFSAAMSSTAGELNALASTTVVDFYKRLAKPEASDAHYVRASQLFTLGWGVLAILFASFASLVDNLIESVNILGSLFYGTILGIFMVGFFLRFVGGRAVLVAGIFAELTVLVMYQTLDVGYLWYNIIGCALVVGISMALQLVIAKEE